MNWIVLITKKDEKAAAGRRTECSFRRAAEGCSSPILLAHNPLYGDTYLDWRNLTLSGHLHGGMIRLGKRAVVVRIFTLLRWLRDVPERGFQPYRLFSAGMGEHTIPVRICNPRELVVVELWGE